MSQLGMVSGVKTASGADSPCVGHCTTVLGDDVCRSCLRTFEEITQWVTMTDAQRTEVNQRIATEQTLNGK